jgi:hypothetical protein
MKKPANLKSTIEQLKALQIKARGQFEKISEDATGKPLKIKKVAVKKPVRKKKLKPVVKKKIIRAAKRKPQSKTKVKPRVKKLTLWRRLFKTKARTVRRRIPRNRRIR